MKLYFFSYRELIVFMWIQLNCKLRDRRKMRVAKNYPSLWRLFSNWKNLLPFHVTRECSNLSFDQYVMAEMTANSHILVVRYEIQKRVLLIRYGYLIGAWPVFWIGDLWILKKTCRTCRNLFYCNISLPEKLPLYSSLIFSGKVPLLNRISFCDEHCI